MIQITLLNGRTIFVQAKKPTVMVEDDSDLTMTDIARLQLQHHAHFISAVETRPHHWDVELSPLS